MVLVSARAQAAGLEVQMPAECGSSEQFAHEVRQRVGNPENAPPSNVRISPVEGGYRLFVQVGAHHRELDARDCLELFGAAIVIVVAIVQSDAALDAPRTDAPDTAAAPVEPTPIRAELAPKVSESEPRRALPREPPPRRGPSPAWGLGVGVGANAGLLPRPTLAAELEASVLWSERVGLALGARYVAPGASQDVAGRGVSVSAYGAHAVGLFRPWRVMETRLGFSAYRLSGVGLGSLERSRDAAWSLGPTAGGAFFPLQRGGTWLAIGVDLELHLVRSRFEILNYGGVFTVPVAGGFAFLRLGHLFF